MRVVGYLGMKFDGHDTAAFLLLPDHKEAYGLSTERLTRVKHDNLFPICTTVRLAEEAQQKVAGLKYVRCANSFSSHQQRLYPSKKFSDDLRSRQANDLISNRTLMALSDSRMQSSSAPPYERLHETMLRSLRAIFPGAEVTVDHIDHEYCHARSAYHLSPFEDALVLTMDGSGDTGTFSRSYFARSGRFTAISQSVSTHRLSSELFSKPCSFGGIYSYFTHLLGFEPNSDEGKVEALAAYGRRMPRLFDRLNEAWGINKRTHSVELDERALTTICLDYQGLKGNRGSYADIAATIQGFTEVAILEYTRYLLTVTGAKSLCVAGGVFANVMVNMRLSELLGDRLYVTPAMGDEGSAQGAAIAVMVASENETNSTCWLRDLEMPYFGPSYSRPEAEAAVAQMSDYIRSVEYRSELAGIVAARIHHGQIGAVFQGRSEFGPRALGNRSILASPCYEGSRSRINTQIKRRPAFQPVCPSILDEEISRLFEFAYPNKHMTCAFQMRTEFRQALPSAIHVDGTARVQFVSECDNPWLYSLLKQLKELSGYGVVVNTSFNIHGRAMVENPTDAIRDFIDSGLDFLVIEGILVERYGCFS